MATGTFKKTKVHQITALLLPDSSIGPQKFRLKLVRSGAQTTLLHVHETQVHRLACSVSTRTTTPSLAWPTPTPSIVTILVVGKQEAEDLKIFQSWGERQSETKERAPCDTKYYKIYRNPNSRRPNSRKNSNLFLAQYLTQNIPTTKYIEIVQGFFSNLVNRMTNSHYPNNQFSWAIALPKNATD